MRRVAAGVVLGVGVGTVAVRAAAPPGVDPSVERLYQAHCHACHGTGAADAPITHEPRDWAERTPKGLDVLVARAKKGPEGMPPMGGCYRCSDADLAALIRYMSAAP